MLALSSPAYSHSPNLENHTMNDNSNCEKNILLAKSWNSPHEAPPFDLIKIEDYIPAITAQIESSQRGVDAIVSNSEKPTFLNTIVALENNGKELSRTLGVLFNLNASNTSDDLQKVVIEVTPLLTEHSNNISLNASLFQRVKAVWDSRASLSLNAEDSMLLSKSYKGFTRSGANLSESDKESYRAISTELAELAVKFEQNDLAATNDFVLIITDQKDLSGLPESIIEAAEAEAKGRELEDNSWAFTLHAPSLRPFLKYSDNRALREEIWRASGTLCATGDKNDNQEIVKRIAELRLQIAQLLGYNTYADYALDNRMAHSAQTVNDFLEELLDKTINYAKADAKLIEDYARSNGFSEELMPWDFSYWNEKYVSETFEVNDEMTRPYFKLEDCEQALFLLADKLYGLKFIENSEVPRYHPDVVAYDVLSEEGESLALLYCDYFPRSSKSSGAWMNTFREAYIDENGEKVTPIVVLVNNFTKPTATKPSLLSFSEFETMLHEFGHGLHGIMGKGSYASLTGTSVYQDFVELPSQMLENWASEKEYLDLFAKHYETSESMPAELIEKIEKSKNHLAAFYNVTQVRYATIDMAWHSITSPVECSVEEFEKGAVGKTQILPTVDGIFMSPAFGHIFGGGYAAGYYSYKWAEVLDADAFSKFKAAGIFNREVADSFRENILERGGTEDPMTLYIRFAGSEPTIEPLIERMGLTK